MVMTAKAVGKILRRVIRLAALKFRVVVRLYTVPPCRQLHERTNKKKSFTCTAKCNNKRARYMRSDWCMGVEGKKLFSAFRNFFFLSNKTVNAFIRKFRRSGNTITSVEIDDKPTEKPYPVDLVLITTKAAVKDSWHSPRGFYWYFIVILCSKL